MSTKVFVMTHKKFPEPPEQVYVPMQVGKADAEDLGYLGDDTEDNISKSNIFYGELTGLYWVWKNFHNADNVGICHYRRYFLDQDQRLLTEEDYERILSEYDIIVSNRAYADGSYLEYYSEGHNVNDLLVTGEVLKEKYPEYYPFFKQAIDENIYFFGNLMVTSKEKFDAYATWLFDILFEVEKRIDVSDYDLYNQRVYGFLSEQLLKVWIDKNQLKIYEGIVGITAEKAETVEFKLAISQLLKMGEIEQAKDFFYEFMNIRPDVRLELSDIKGEIPIIEHILYICDEERKRDITGMYSNSSDLNKLIEQYLAILDIMKKCAQEDGAEQECNYIIENNISWVPIVVILMNVMDKELDRGKVKEEMQRIFTQIGKPEYAEMLANVTL